APAVESRKKTETRTAKPATEARFSRFIHLSYSSFRIMAPPGDSFFHLLRTGEEQESCAEKWLEVTPGDTRPRWGTQQMRGFRVLGWSGCWVGQHLAAPVWRVFRGLSRNPGHGFPPIFVDHFFLVV